MIRITHSLVGYDRISERVAEEFDVPDTVLPEAKALARVPADDPEAIMCYPLDASGARDLADIIKARIHPEQRDYFLEGVAGEAAAYEFADDAAFRPRSQPMPPDGLLAPVKEEWSVWIHNDLAKDHVKVTVTRTTVDAYATRLGYKGHRVVIDSLNREIRSRVAQAINRAIAEGRATAAERVQQDHTCKHLELTGHDLAVMLDG